MKDKLARITITWEDKGKEGPDTKEVRGLLTPMVTFTCLKGGHVACTWWPGCQGWEWCAAITWLSLIDD